MANGSDKMQTEFPTLTTHADIVFQNMSKNSIMYDGFMEVFPSTIGLPSDHCINLEGQKPPILTHRYEKVVSTQSPSHWDASYGLKMRPAAQNIYHQIPGSEIFIHDSSLVVDAGPSSNYILHLTGFDPIRLNLLLPFLKIFLRKFIRKVC